MSHRALSMAQLHEAVESFRQTSVHHGYEGREVRVDEMRDPHLATSMCAEVDGAFCSHIARTHGVDTTGLEGRLRWQPHGLNHYASEVPTEQGPHVVDFTYNQFQGLPHERVKPAPFPLVEPLKQYRQRWDQLEHG